MTPKSPPISLPPKSPPTNQPPLHPPILPPKSPPTNQPPLHPPILPPKSPPTNQPPLHPPILSPKSPPTNQPPLHPPILSPKSPPISQPPVHPPANIHPPISQPPVHPPANIHPPISQPPVHSPANIHPPILPPKSPTISQPPITPISDIQTPPLSPIAPPYSPIHTIFDTDMPLHNILEHYQLPPHISDVLPDQYTYIFTQYQSLSLDNTCAFTATIYVDTTSESEATKWIVDLENYTATTFRITRGTKTTGQRILYKTIRHCQHKRKKSKKHHEDKFSICRRDKKTDCPTTLILKLHNQTKSTPKFYITHPCEVQLHWHHNHSVKSAHALSFRPIAEKEKIL